jgi:hypothetical protein
MAPVKSTSFRLVCTHRELDEFHMLASACDMSLAELIRTLLKRQISYLKTGEKEKSQPLDVSDLGF